MNFLALLCYYFELYTMNNDEVKQDEVQKVVSIADILNKATEEGFEFKFDPDTGVATFKFECAQMMDNGHEFSAIVTLTQADEGVKLYQCSSLSLGGTSVFHTLEEVFDVLKRYDNYIMGSNNHFPNLEQEQKVMQGRRDDLGDEYLDDEDLDESKNVTIYDIVDSVEQEGFDSEFDPYAGVATFTFECARMMDNGCQFSATVTLTQKEGRVELQFWANGLEGGSSSSTTVEEVLEYLNKYKSYIVEDGGSFHALDAALRANEELLQAFDNFPLFDEDRRE